MVLNFLWVNYTWTEYASTLFLNFRLTPALVVDSRYIWGKYAFWSAIDDRCRYSIVSYKMLLYDDMSGVRIFVMWEVAGPGWAWWQSQVTSHTWWSQRDGEQRRGELTPSTTTSHYQSASHWRSSLWRQTEREEDMLHEVRMVIIIRDELWIRC